eukprot:COSAG01_NODE_2091_length_8453_cov_19.448049_1_plen_29_part_10
MPPPPRRPSRAPSTHLPPVGAGDADSAAA